MCMRRARMHEATKTAAQRSTCGAAWPLSLWHGDAQAGAESGIGSCVWVPARAFASAFNLRIEPKQHPRICNAAVASRPRPAAPADTSCTRTHTHTHNTCRPSHLVREQRLQLVPLRLAQLLAGELHVKRDDEVACAVGCVCVHVRVVGMCVDVCVVGICVDVRVVCICVDVCVVVIVCTIVGTRVLAVRASTYRHAQRRGMHAARTHANARARAYVPFSPGYFEMGMPSFFTTRSLPGVAT